jgi:signal transduction histidine kinase
VQSDAALLTVVLRNLVRNALKYTPAGGRVLLGCRSSGSEVAIEVIDTGSGIPADQFSTIFQAFHRLDSRQSDGLGIGLFVVRRIVDLLGHGIEVSSKLGQGSCFSMRARTAAQFHYPPPCLIPRQSSPDAASHGSQAVI